MKPEEYEKMRREKLKTRPNAPDCRKLKHKGKYSACKNSVKHKYGAFANSTSSFSHNGRVCYGYHI